MENEMFSFLSSNALKRVESERESLMKIMKMEKINVMVTSTDFQCSTSIQRRTPVPLPIELFFAADDSDAANIPCCAELFDRGSIGDGFSLVSIQHHTKSAYCRGK